MARRVFLQRKAFNLSAVRLGFVFKINVLCIFEQSTGCPKKWCIFKNAVIRNGKHVVLIFLHDLDKWKRKTPKKFNFLPLSSADLWQKYAFLSKKWPNKFSQFF